MGGGQLACGLPVGGVNYRWHFISRAPLLANRHERANYRANHLVTEGGRRNFEDQHSIIIGALPRNLFNPTNEARLDLTARTGTATKGGEVVFPH